MPSTYFIAIKPRLNHNHMIHREGCPFMPDDGKRIYLGNFRSVLDAISEGKRHFFKSDSCPFCSHEHHSGTHETVSNETGFPITMITFGKMTPGWESALQCCVN